MALASLETKEFGGPGQFYYHVQEPVARSLRHLRYIQDSIVYVHI